MTPEPRTSERPKPQSRREFLAQQAALGEHTSRSGPFVISPGALQWDRPTRNVWALVAALSVVAGAAAHGMHIAGRATTDHEPAVVTQPIAATTASPSPANEISKPPVAPPPGLVAGIIGVPDPQSPGGLRQICSGTHVNAGTSTVIVTAAHCLHHHRNAAVAYAPAASYTANRSHVTYPYGVFPLRRIGDQVATWPALPTHGVPVDWDLDFAFTQPLPRADGQLLHAILPGEAISFQHPLELANATAVGYSLFDGTLRHCRGATSSQPVARNGDEAIVGLGPYRKLVCPNMTEGTPGSPIYADVDPVTGRGTLVGVIGGPAEGGMSPDVSYSSDFREPGAASAFAAAAAQ